MLTLKNGDFEAVISEKGAELKSFKRLSDNKEFIWCADETVWPSSAPVLFPFCGQLKDKEFIYNERTYQIARHGFAKFSVFKEKQLSENIAEFTLTHNLDTLDKYPFRFELTIRYTLKNSALKNEFIVKNTDNKTIYYGIGGHTGFATEGNGGLSDCSLEFIKAKESFGQKINNDGLRLEQKYNFLENNILKLSQSLFDGDALVFENAPSNVVLLKRKDSDTIKFSFKNLKSFVVWAKKGTDRFVCLEPWTGPNESINADKNIDKKTNLVVLQQGKKNTHSFTFKVTK